MNAGFRRMVLVAAMALVALSTSAALAQAPRCGGGWYRYAGGYRYGGCLPSYPQYPVYQSPPHFSGYGPWGCGPNTSGTTVYNSAFDPWREASKWNGTAHYVSHPVAGGWETGTEWYNHATGQWHGNTTVVSPNGLGGFHSENHIRSARSR